jgi:hypothetical protein
MRLVDLNNDGVVSLFGANHQGHTIELWQNLQKGVRTRFRDIQPVVPPQSGGQRSSGNHSDLP